MNTKKDIKELLAKFLLGNITDPEKECLNDWMNKSEENRIFFNRLCNDNSFRERYKAYSQIDSHKPWIRFMYRYYTPSFFKYTFLRYASIVLIPLLIAVGGWYYLSSGSTKKIYDFEAAETILPGISKATLIISDTIQETLASSEPKAVNVSAATRAVCQNGILTYSIHPKADRTAPAVPTHSNALITEENNEFRVIFEDGTNVHLNCNTRLRYPVKFGKNERIVYLEGEAYFKVSNDERPFYVITKQGKIKQYGTEFNVNTFTPGRTEVVLVQGSIGITSDVGQKEQLLNPGQLAYLEESTDEVLIYEVDVKPYVAWNEGRLIFEDHSLEKIMEILERWYNVKVEFGSPELKLLRFTGNMDKYDTINPILKAIARTKNLRIEIEERKILITTD